MEEKIMDALIFILAVVAIAGLVYWKKKDDWFK
jgi:hypothetical protein